MTTFEEAPAREMLTADNAGELLRQALDEWHPQVYELDGQDGRKVTYNPFYKHYRAWFNGYAEDPLTMLDVHAALGQAAGEAFDYKEMMELQPDYEAVGQIVLEAADILDKK